MGRLETQVMRSQRRRTSLQRRRDAEAKAALEVSTRPTVLEETKTPPRFEYVRTMVTLVRRRTEAEYQVPGWRRHIVNRNRYDSAGRKVA